MLASFDVAKVGCNQSTCSYGRHRTARDTSGARKEWKLPPADAKKDTPRADVETTPAKGRSIKETPFEKTSRCHRSSRINI
jgi:hypothetical protein